MVVWIFIRNERLNSRFEIFSMNVRVAHSSFDKGSVYGNVSVLDTYRSKPDGWVSIDKEDDCYVSYFNREWYEPEDINNDSCIPFGDPSCLQSIPFGSSIEVEVLLQATSEEKDQIYLLTNCKGSPPLSGFWSDEDSNLKYGTLRYAGEEGHVLLNYALIKNAVDTKVDLTFKHVRGAARAFGDIVAYYGDDVLGDRGFLGHYYALIFRADPTQYIGMQGDQILPLLKSTLAVPVNGLLKIKALLTDVDSGEVIVDDSVEFTQSPDGVSIESIQSVIGSFELRVDWVPQLPSGSSTNQVSLLFVYWN